MSVVERLKRAVEFQIRLNDFMLWKFDGFEGKLSKLIEDELVTVLKDLGTFAAAPDVPPKQSTRKL